MLVQKYYFDAEYSAVRNDREISINSFRKKRVPFRNTSVIQNHCDAL